MKNDNVISGRDLYRLPWNLADNVFSWLEPTSMCNLACQGCYRTNVKGSHKSLDEIRRELDVFQQKRNADCMMIAGGEPLLHPQIIGIVREIASRGLKPYIGTNGLLLTRELLLDLKKAGLCSIGFHIDSKQGRGGRWRGKNEIELNDLRLEFAHLVADVGDISCSFDATVYEDTLQYVPDLVSWAHQHIDIVHDIAFVAYRQVAPESRFQWFAGSKPIGWQALPYRPDGSHSRDVLSTDMVVRMREAYPDFSPAAYLNGSENVDSFKWLISVRIGTRKQIYGYPGPKFMELVMDFHHFTKGTYPGGGLSSPSKHGRAAMLLLWPFDRGMRRTAVRMLRNPLNLLRHAHIQTVVFIQPIDFMPDGRQSMCDGCPDMTVFNGELVWSCRLEEMIHYGTMLRSALTNGAVVESTVQEDGSKQEGVGK